MFGFLNFILLVVVLFWILSLSRRLSDLENGKIKRPAVDGFDKELQSADLSSSENIIQQPMSSDLEKEDNLPKHRDSDIRDEEKASNWLSRIGIVALIFGVGFFLKYAIDQGWLGELARVLVGYAVGALFIVLGDIWRKRYRNYSQALTGGGVAIIYFSVFAAYQFYGLINQGVGATAVIFIIALTYFLSRRNESAPLAVLAVFGAYLAPIVLHAGIDQHILLFVYLVLLQFGVLAILFNKYSAEVSLTSILGTILVFSLWAVEYSIPENTVASMVFIFISMILFYLGTAVALREQKNLGDKDEKNINIQGVIFFIGGIFYAMSSYLLLSDHFPDNFTIVSILQGLVVLSGYLVLGNDKIFKQLRYILATVSSLFVLIGTVWELENEGLIMALLFFGIVVLGIGAVAKRIEFRMIGLVVLLFGTSMALFNEYDHLKYQFLFNEKFGLSFMSVLLLWFSAWLYRFTEIDPFEKSATLLVKTIAIMTLWFAFSWEIVYYFRDSGSVNAKNLILSLWWIAYALIILIYGALAKEAIYRKLAIGLFGISIVKVFIYDVAALDTGYRVVSFITLGIILLAVSYTYQRNKEKINEFLESRDTEHRIEN